MKFLLIGATGPTGQEIVQQGLAQGHEITALVRDASKITVSGPHLNLVAGDILNPLEVDAAMAGQDAVVCSLGTGVTFKHVTLFSDGTRPCWMPCTGTRFAGSCASPALAPVTVAATADFL